MEFQIEVRDYEVRLGRCPEEGTDYFGLSYAVVATRRDGRRWVHTRQFLDAVQGYDEEFRQSFYRRGDGSAKVNAQRLADRVFDHLLQGGKLDLANHWEEAEPAYGSEAYVADGVEEARWLREREDAMMGLD